MENVQDCFILNQSERRQQIVHLFFLLLAYFVFQM